MENLHNTAMPTPDLSTATNIPASIGDSNTVIEKGQIVDPNVVQEKKKRGRKKNSVLATQNLHSSSTNDGLDSTSVNVIIPEKKIRKKRTIKPKVSMDVVVTSDIVGESTEPLVKKRKRRVCKNKNTVISGDVNTNSLLNNTIDGNSTSNDTSDDTIGDNSVIAPPIEEKVAKKRGRKPKGGKIITQQVNETNNTNDMPNIILHLKCFLSSIQNNNENDSFNGNNNDSSDVQSYDSSQLSGSEINSIVHAEKKEINRLDNVCGADNNSRSNIKNISGIFNNNNNNEILSNKSDHLYKVYDPNIPLHETRGGFAEMENNSMNSSMNSNMFNITYSPDINLYSTGSIGNHGIQSNHSIHSIQGTNNGIINDNDNDDDTNTHNLNEREIWRKINQLKLSFHKSDICQNIGGTQRSACFWCTCEFDSPAIYIPKSCSKESYQVYGCFCSPECAAAFLMNENVDTSTRFERYHLLNSIYGKIYKYEKSIKIAPNPYYLLNKYYGNLTIQEYRKLFQSDQMIYVVNKPLTHILPELYEDNNDFLLNTKIIPTHSVNIKKNKPLKSNILNNAFGITGVK
jgi:hypothetical protein